MASRNRNRQAPMKDDAADEERSIWNQLVLDAKRIDALVTQHNAKWNRMQELKDLIEEQHENGEDPDPDFEDELMKLSRENLKLCEDIAAGIEGPSENEPDSILGSLSLLKALRSSSEADSGSSYSAPPPRAAATTAKAARNPKRKADALGSTGSAGSGAGLASAAASASGVSTPGPSYPSVTAPSEDRDLAGPDSPGTPVSVSAASSVAGGTTASVAGGGGSSVSNAGPSPKVVVVPTTNRLKAHSSSRAGSVPAGREASVKIEEGADSGAEPSKHRARYVKEAEVFFRNPKKASKDDQGEGILCRVKSKYGEGKALRYEVQDVDPESAQAMHMARPQQLSLIPPTNDGVPDPPMRRTILAMYPGTTTFYRSELVSARGSKRGHVRLRFEDEEDKNQEQEVERRYVLVEWPGKQP